MDKDTSVPAVDCGRLDFEEVADLFRDNLPVLLACVAGALLLMFAYLHHAQPVYAATAVLEARPDPRLASPPGADGTDFDDTLKTIELELTNPSVLFAVARTQRLAEDPLYASPGDSPDQVEARLAKNLDVELERGSRLIDVTARDYDPVKARQIAAAVLAEFFRQNAAYQNSRTAGNRQLLLDQAHRLGSQLQAAEERLEDYRERNHAVSLDQSQNIVADRMKDLNQQVAAAKSNRLALQTEEDQVRRLSGSNPEALLSLQAIAAAPEVLDLRKAIALQEAQVATLSQRYGPLHPTMIQARSQLADLHSSLDAAIRRQGALIGQNLAAARSTEAALTAALSQQENTALALDRLAIPYHALEREVQADASLYQRILDSLRQTDANRGLFTPDEVDGAQVRIVAPPSTPDEPVSPRRKLLLFLAALGGLAVGAIVAIGRRALDTTLSSVDAAESTLGLPVLATVPQSRVRKFDARPIVVRRPASPDAEAFRALRTSLSLLHEEDGYRTVLFTSAVPGEGKSTCALNFASSLAQQGLRTLLIDADLWRPGLQRRFSGASRPGVPGLSDCLKNPAAFSRSVLPTPVEHLFRLGDWEPKAGGAELLGAEGPLRELLARAQAEFERVVVDVPPVLAISDTLQVARQVDVVCLVVDTSRTPGRLVKRAAKLLEEVARRPASGIVLNRIGRRHAGRRYYNYGHAYGETAVA